MKIVNRTVFLQLPAGAVFAKYSPCAFGELLIKGDTYENSNDFTYQDITSAINCDTSNEYDVLLDRAVEEGISIQMDLDSSSRDGLFDDDQLFAVFERCDVESLIARLQSALTDGYTAEV